MANYLIEELYKQADKYRDTEFCRFREPGQIFWKSTARGEFLDDV